jgi:membrane protease YdiL (CAAX protease family)
MIERVNLEGESTPVPTPRWSLSGPGGSLRPISRALLFLIGWYIVWLQLPAAVFKLGPGLSLEAKYAVMYVLLNAALLVESWLFVRGLDRRSFRTVGLWFYPGWWKELMGGVGIGTGLIGLVVVVLFESGAVHYYGLTGPFSELLPRLVMAACILLLGAAFEELAFRGYGFQRLVDGVGPVVAVAVFSGLFGALHLSNPSATLLSTANTVLTGVLLSVAYLKTRALWLPIGLHWAWNFFQGPIFSLPVSGLQLWIPLLRAEVSGAKWLTGGAYGPEGGVVQTVACLAAVVWLARTRRVTTSLAMEEVLK